ncbi:MAG: hypothetical protein IPI44_11490 [Sulfuritalea sp.]|nr:hypothetical protein [Sulfuritalea sp.]
MALEKFRPCLDQGVERGPVKRLGFFLSRPIVHGPTKAASGLAVLDHLDGTSFMVLVLDNASGPAIVAPESRVLFGEGGICASPASFIAFDVMASFYVPSSQRTVASASTGYVTVLEAAASGRDFQAERFRPSRGRHSKTANECFKLSSPR